MRYLYILTILVLLSAFSSAQNATIFGIITDENNQAIEFANITVKGKAKGTSTSENGQYELNVTSNEDLIIVFSTIGFKNVEKTLKLGIGERKEINIALMPDSKQLTQVVIEDKQVRKSTLTRLDPKIMSVIPEASGNFEAIIKTLPGVASNNELSSQYSVRGGSFDENLVYVNDIEIYRPFLIRAGQQEGLSFINSDMVSSVLFSAGGFDAKYGDKMSSVLDIKYKKPTEFGGVASASLMGGGLTLMGDSKNKKFTHITGFRYKSGKYMLNSLETKGSYDPKFLDLQTYLTYDVADKVELSFLGNLAQNKYHFVPENRKTKFGTMNNALELNMYYDGQELDEFLTYTGAVALDYSPSDDLNLKLITSAFHTNERETFDILTEYLINEVEKDLSSEDLGDSVANIGVGAYLKHARNYLQARVYSIEHKGYFTGGISSLQWGLRAQTENIQDNLSEWKMIDSAGYSLPYSNEDVNMQYVIKGKNTAISQRYMAYLQNAYNYNLNSGELNFTVGLRSAYWTFNSELVVSPRASLAYIPKWEKDFLFRFSTGYYYQPAFYKEMRRQSIPDENGNVTVTLNDEIKAQKSIHFVLGSDYNFLAWNRPFKLVTEAYYKILRDLIPYSIDNVRILYQGYNNSDGYAMGIDMKVNGEFVQGVDSWFSFSLMRTQEDIRNDGEYKIIDSTGNVYWDEPGLAPRPSDQRVNIGMFFQDYFPGNPDYKMHLQINFGTRLPFGPPNKPLYYDSIRMKSYQRVDLGFSKVLKRPDKDYPEGHWLHHVNEAWVSAEVFNLMDRENTISHEWVTDFRGRGYAVENSLTGRRINVKLTVRF